MKRIALLLGVLLILVATTSAALAFGSYQPTFQSTYPAAKGSALDSCNLCHGANMALNPYGKDFGAANHNYAAIEGKDSDGDGATNLAEIKALTMPGDPASKPAAATQPGTSAPKTPAPSQPKVKSAIETLAEKGIVTGSGGSLRAGDKVTRAEFATFLLRIGNLPKTWPFTPGFKDVPKSVWYFPIVEAVTRAGAMSGYEDGTFKPNGTVDGATALKAIAAMGVEVKNDALAAKSALTRGEAATLLLELYNSKDKVTFTNYVVGAESCARCHSNEFKDWKGTMHSRMMITMDTPGATNANFATNDKFTPADVYFVVGGLTSNYFVGKDLKYLPLGWSLEEKEWKARSVSSWTGCASCHATGFDKDKVTWTDMGITCENCHGAGAKHIAKGGDKTQIKSSVGNDSCISCHGGDRQGDPLQSMGHTTVFAEKIKLPYYRESCMECHSATVFIAHEKGVTPPTLADFKTGAYQNDRTGISCAVCHDPHKKEHEFQLRKDEQETCVQCHTGELAEGAKFTAGKEVHHPQKEMVLGVGGIDVPDIKMAKVANCVDCHMTNGNHYFKVGTPKLTLISKGKPYEVDSCAKCHTAMTAEDIEKLQGEIEGKLEALKAKLNSFKAKLDNAKALKLDVTTAQGLYDAALTNVTFVEADKSKGIHNPAYARALLAEAEKKVNQLYFYLP